VLELRGANALLTGAAGGLGGYIARALAAEGVNLALSDRPEAALEDVIADARLAGVRAKAVPAELTDPDQLRALVGAAEEELGPIDVLVNNAGVEHGGPFLSCTADELEAISAINLTAVMELTRQALPGMLKRRRGHIVNVASIAGKIGFPFLASYCATKHGVVGFTHALRTELGVEPVGVSAICPAIVRRAGMFGRVEELLPEIPQEVGGIQPEDVAAAVVRAIRENRAELVLNNRPTRPVAAVASVWPGAVASLMRRQSRLMEFGRAYSRTQGRL
jgi:short-subunit dehydrogenase